MSPNRFGVLENEEDTSGSSVPTEGEELIFSDHIRKSGEQIDMLLTRSKSKVSVSNKEL